MKANGVPTGIVKRDGSVVSIDPYRAITEPGYLLDMLGGEAALPPGLRPGDIVGPRPNDAQVRRNARRLTPR